MAIEKRGKVLFNSKKGISNDLFFNVFEYMLAFVVLVALFQFVNEIIEQTIFEKNYLARDIALLVNTLSAAPGEITYTYNEDTSKFLVEFNENVIIVYEADKDPDLRNTFYIYGEHETFPVNIPSDDTLEIDDPDNRIVFSKSEFGIDADTTGTAP